MKLIYLSTAQYFEWDGRLFECRNAEQDGSVEHTHELPCARA